MRETWRSDAYEASTMNTPYDILGVPRSASDEAIKAAFHSAAKACHPDLNAGDPSAAQKLKQLIAARGPISVADYMEAANGHYYASRDPFGAATWVKFSGDLPPGLAAVRCWRRCLS